MDHINTLITAGIAFVLFGISFLLSNMLYSEYSYEKISSYECGFDAFSDARDPFDIKFYLIGILFIIFDIEVLFFFPMVFSIHELFYYNIFIMFLFLLILMLGFAYEWKKGCMDWD